MPSIQLFFYNLVILRAVENLTSTLCLVFCRLFHIFTQVLIGVLFGIINKNNFLILRNNDGFVFLEGVF